jgi:hypothetical protein
VISNALISIVLVIMAVRGRRGQANLVAAPKHHHKETREISNGGLEETRTAAPTTPRAL